MERASTLILEATRWLENCYERYTFFVERDIVWTIQGYLVDCIDARRLPYRVFNDYPMIPGSRRSLSADLAIVSVATGDVLAAAEFKYEPSHSRSDILKTKFPVVFWGKDGVQKDIKRIQQFVAEGRTEFACAIFIDEGGAFRHREPHPGSEWQPFGKCGSILYSEEERSQSERPKDAS